MPGIAAVLLGTGLVMVIALLAAAAAAKIARLTGATYPSAVMKAATTFAGTVALAATVAATLAQLLR
ncbi:hypothetical protein ABZY81_39180 [Streptomyces sp. NPDC006514]|uniref:hypothetical protein n=1 Tax=Streptomyces sp. NPDC006514 TaxID=3154308 RepID=UPI0033A84459